MKIITNDVFDFTNCDQNEDSFEVLIKAFNAMRVSANELPSDVYQSMGIYPNSIHGAYGIYRTGDGKPDVVIVDVESPINSGSYYYKIKVFLLSPKQENLYEDVLAMIHKIMEENS